MASFSQGIRRACEVFQVSELYKEQIECLKAVIEKKNVYASLPTGYGKSMIFYALPIVADEVYGLEPGTSKVVVISPLKSLMEDQVKFLKSLGLKAVALHEEQEEADIQSVEQGKAVYLFTSPEKVLNSSRWRKLICGGNYRESLMGIIIDEAHCISQWGLPGLKLTPFRYWYGNIGEIRSLVSSNVPLIALTATASKSTKNKIFECLNLTQSSTFVIERNPEKPNIKFCVQYVKKDLPISKLFDTLIEEVREKNTSCERTIIFCQTRKQCAVVYKTFEDNLGESFYVQGDGNHRERLVEMYHAGTPSSVKAHILKNLNDKAGCIRIITCTVAFGMGVNCQGVNRVIHFAPAKNLEAYIQECGRSGRDGQPSLCTLLYNGLLSAHCNVDIKEYTTSNECRRFFIYKHFPGNFNCIAGHNCCDICPTNSDVSECTQEDLPVLKLNVNEPEQDNISNTKVRIATPENKKRLKEKLYIYMKTLIISNSAGANIVSTNILREFTQFHIEQVLEYCEYVTCIADIEKYVEVWRREHSFAILKAIADVFMDDNLEVPDTCLSTAELGDYEEDEIQQEWLDIRDDSHFDFLSESDFANLDAHMDDVDQSGNDNRNASSLIEELINVSNTSNNN